MVGTVPFPPGTLVLEGKPKTRLEVVVVLDEATLVLVVAGTRVLVVVATTAVVETVVLCDFPMEVNSASVVRGDGGI